MLNNTTEPFHKYFLRILLNKNDYKKHEYTYIWAIGTLKAYWWPFVNLGNGTSALELELEIELELKLILQTPLFLIP